VEQDDLAGKERMLQSEIRYGLGQAKELSRFDSIRDDAGFPAGEDFELPGT